MASASPPSRAPGWPARPTSSPSTSSTRSSRTPSGSAPPTACKPDELDALKAELTGDGFDYAFEAIGLPVTIRAAYDAIRRGGTACIIGVGAMDKEVTFNAFELFFAEKTFKGSYYGSADVRSDFHRLLRLWKAGQLDLEGMITRMHQDRRHQRRLRRR